MSRRNDVSSNHYSNALLSEGSADGSSGPVALERFERSPKLAELKVAYRSRTKVQERRTLRNSTDAADYLRAIWNANTLELVEEFVMICLNGSGEAIGWVKVSSGGMNATQVDSRLVFAIALQTACTAIVVAHNHPGGKTDPSPQDKEITQRLKEAGRLLGIAVLDHIIISRDSAFSFAENGLL